MPRKVFAHGIKIICFLSFLWSGNRLLAQPDCRSILGAHIKPIGESPVSWAVEGMGTAGIMPDRTIANWSAYAALSYAKGDHQLYFEGTFKDWYNSASNPDGQEPQTGLPNYNRPTTYHWGFRELNYSYSKGYSSVKLGIQGIKAEDYFLFDERALGISATTKLAGFKLTANAGTVSQRLARFQDVCGTRHVYNLFHRSEFNFVGEKPGETNFAGAFLKWTPSSVKSKKSTGNTTPEPFDEFGSDEFSSDEYGSKKHEPALKIKESGLFFYEEFGSGFHEYKYYSGIFSNFTLPFKTELKSEFVDQYILNDHALAYWISMLKTFSWNNGSSSKIDFSYLGKLDITEGAHFYPAFSNLMLGEVMRLDAIDLPLLSGSFKHFFPGKTKTTIQLNGVMQLQGDHSQETDLIAGIKLFKHMRITTILGYLTSERLEQDYWFSKLEIRLAF